MKLGFRFLSGFLLLALAGNVFAADNPVVEILKFQFTPKEITVTPGTTIRWINKDETPHTLKASDGSFVSKAMDTDDKYEHTFATEGDFSYFCTLHPFMTGVVHVHPNKGK
jgi:plastocyanin